MDDDKRSPKRRKKLHNEKAINYFCSVPFCLFFSTNKHEFEDHYEGCLQTARRRKGKNGDLVPTNGHFIEPLNNGYPSTCHEFENGGLSSIQLKVIEDIPNAPNTKNKDYSSVPLFTVDPANAIVLIGTNAFVTSSANFKHGIEKNQYSHDTKINNMEDEHICKGCRKVFRSKSLLRMHSQKNTSQKNECQRKQSTTGESQITSVQNKQEMSKPNACRFCNRIFKRRFGLKRHMERFHYKTAKSWNGREFVTAITISLTSSGTNRKKGRNRNHKNGTNSKLETERTKVHSSDMQKDVNIKKFNKQTKAFVEDETEMQLKGYDELNEVITNLENVEQRVNVTRDDSLRTNSLVEKKSQNPAPSFDTYFKKILKYTVNAIFDNTMLENNSIRGLENIVTSKSLNNGQNPLKPSNKKGGTKTRVKEMNTHFVATSESVKNKESASLIALMQSLSLGCSNKPSKRNYNKLDSFFSKIFWKYDDDVFRHDYIYQTVMKEIRKNEAKIILHKVM